MIELLNIDCMEYMKGCKDNQFDLAICDPPYGIGDTFIGFSSGAVKGKLERIHKEMKWDDAIPTPEYFAELKRVSKNQIIWGANYFNCFSEKGGALVWYKNRGGDTLSQCEIASVSNQRKVDYAKLQILTGFCSNEERIHPTQKPVALYKWILDNYAKCSECEGSGEVASLTIDCDVQTCKKCKGNDFKVLDTHLGSGNIAVACHYAGVDLVGCEIDKEYYDKAMNNLKQNTVQTSLF
jgi:site-specific DNA-methyltransferase (adenine-specific)